jgi:hypothetical protein
LAKYKNIQAEINRNLEIIGNKKTHNSNPATIEFMKAARSLDSFKEYFTKYQQQQPQQQQPQQQQP